MRSTRPRQLNKRQKTSSSPPATPPAGADQDHARSALGLSEPELRECTRVLAETGEFDGLDLDALVPEVYADLRRLAARQLARESAPRTLSATALAHEAYLRLSRSEGAWSNRRQVLAIAAHVIRRLLVDHARSRRVRRLASEPVPTAWTTYSGQQFDVLALEESMARLAERDARLHRLVELRFFGGLTIEEVAGVMELSPATVKRRWEFARAWLYRELGGADGR